MLRHCDTQVARAHHCHNEENMLIADSSAGGKTQQSKQHLRCFVLEYGGDGRASRQSVGEAQRWVGWREGVLPDINNEFLHANSQKSDS